MSFLEVFQPGLRYQREQRDLEKTLVVENEAGGSGPRPLDLESGSVVVRVAGGDMAASESAEPVPDDKDWTFVLQRPCPECGYDASTVSGRALPALIRAATAPWPGVLARPDVAARPAPQVWSALEYGCHVRDVLILFTQRLELMLSRHDPVFDNWDQDATAIAERYREAAPATVAGQIMAAAAQSVTSWAGVGPDEWDRTGRRSDGSVFTIGTLGPYFLHDLMHHLHDVGA